MFNSPSVVVPLRQRRRRALEAQRGPSPPAHDAKRILASPRRTPKHSLSSRAFFLSAGWTRVDTVAMSRSNFTPKDEAPSRPRIAVGATLMPVTAKPRNLLCDEQTAAILLSRDITCDYYDRSEENAILGFIGATHQVCSNSLIMQYGSIERGSSNFRQVNRRLCFCTCICCTHIDRVIVKNSFKLHLHPLLIPWLHQL
eukprot:SAG31_NODE_2865_length_4981_cov_4.988529_5_plen_199_part_00